MVCLSDQPHCQDSCDTVLVSASLGSPVLLPCHAPFLGRTDWMLWVQNTGAPLANLSSQGKVWFWEPRQGRVKTFPNEGSRGNFTIRIDGRRESDLGCYQCGPAEECHHQKKRRNVISIHTFLSDNTNNYNKIRRHNKKTIMIIINIIIILIT